MKQHRTQFTCIAESLALGILIATGAQGATSFSNSLTGFSGDSTLPATQAAVGAAGFNFFSTEGLDPEFTMDPTIVLDSTGATFGSLYGGDNGRNYMRTNESDYATVNFVAEITVERTANAQQVFIGMGAGDTALFGVPDWSTLFSSTFVTPEDGAVTTWRSANDGNEWCPNCEAAITAAGTHRVRMEFDSSAKTMTYSMDLNYAGGTFVADVTAPVTDLNHIDCPVGCGFPEMPISADFFAADGWPNEPSRIFFGGDDGTILRDFSVTVSAAPGLDGDFNEDDNVDAADYILWRKNNGTSNPLPNDGGLGTPIGLAHYDLWRGNFGESAGGGSGLAAAGVPEPTSFVLLILGLYAGGFATNRRQFV
jgi:hypothetical protein